MFRTRFFLLNYFFSPLSRKFAVSHIFCAPAVAASSFRGRRRPASFCLRFSSSLPVVFSVLRRRAARRVNLFRSRSKAHVVDLGGSRYGKWCLRTAFALSHLSPPLGCGLCPVRFSRSRLALQVRRLVGRRWSLPRVLLLLQCGLWLSWGWGSSRRSGLELSAPGSSLGFCFPPVVSGGLV